MAMDPATLSAFAKLPADQLRRVLDAVAYRRDLREFLKGCWHIHHPRQALKWNWHLDALAEHLLAVTNGEIQHLLITLPPRSLKSYLISVCWPAWEWMDDPGLQYIATSAIDMVVLRDARYHRELVASDWYQAHFTPTWKLQTGQEGQKSKGYFANTAGGHRISKTTGQKITGAGADRILVDDPLDAKDAFSDKKALSDHVRYFDSTLTTRVNDENESAIVVTMQRLHERDLAGHLIHQGIYCHLDLPAEYPGRCKPTAIGWQDPRTEQGELLFPARLGAKVLARKKKALGSRQYSAQFNQAPAPEGGTIFKDSWIQYWIPGSIPKFDYLVASWDCTFRRSNDSDFVVGQVWGVHGAERYLLDQIRGKMSFTETIAAVRALNKTWQPTKKVRATVVELKANGAKVVATLKKEISSLVGWNPQGSSKEERANAILPLWEAEQVWIPHPDHKPWIRESWKPEVLAFPAARRDDQVDAMTQALLWIREHGPAKPWVASLG